jgi:hypothetical protein
MECDTKRREHITESLDKIIANLTVESGGAE